MLVVDAFYKSVGQNNTNSSVVSEMVNALIGAFGGSTSAALDPVHGFTVGQRNVTTFTTAGYPNISNLKSSDPNTNAGRPKAYLNCLPDYTKWRRGYCSMSNLIW